MTDELHAIIHGRVQMVMFRDFTARRARRYNLRGFVRNLSDGSVEITAQGEKHLLEKLLVALHRGSLLSRVDSVESTWHTSPERYKDFRISY